MNTEEKEQGTYKGTNRNTTSLLGSSRSCYFDTNSAFDISLIPNRISVSSVSLLIDLSSHATQINWKERTAGSLSNDKIRR